MVGAMFERVQTSRRRHRSLQRRIRRLDQERTNGVCHAELQAVLTTQSKKVRGIALPLADLPKDKLQRKCAEAFRAYVTNLDIFGPQANTGYEVIERVHQEVRDGPK